MYKNNSNDFSDHDKVNFYKFCSKYPYQPMILPKKDRIIVIGDIHGDYELAIDILKISKVITLNGDNISWSGNNTVVVQIGDQIDRCRPYDKRCDHPDAIINDENSDIKILKLFSDLHLQAVKHKGAVISLLGNHELMNVMGNMNYVSYKGLVEFENYVDPENPDITFASGKDARKFSFSPGKEYAKLLACTRIPAVIIGSWIFAHAGILPEFIDKVGIKKKNDLYKLNLDIRKWLLGLINKDYISQIVDSFKYSMFWNRILGNIPPNVDASNQQCLEYINPVLQTFQLKHMVIGHTPQFFSNNIGINKTCNDALWRVDTGSSSAFHYFDNKYTSNGIINQFREAQALEILNDSVINIIKL